MSVAPPSRAHSHGHYSPRCRRYGGTADAVRKFTHLLEDNYRHDACEDVLIMSGDQL
jgi:hypothetical protein